MKNNRNWYGQWYTNGKQVRVSLKTDVKEAGMSTHQNQPVCPNCGSKTVLFREKDKTLAAAAVVIGGMRTSAKS